MVAQAAFLDVPRTNGIWLLLLGVFSTVVALFVRQLNVRNGDSPWAFGRLWGVVPFIPVFVVGGVVILIVGH